MDIGTVKSVFGAMPLNQLPAAQLLAKKKRNQIYLIGGACLLVGVGVYLGIKFEKARNHRLQLKNAPTKSLADNYFPKPHVSQENSIDSKSDQTEKEESPESVIETSV